mgnify:CR=1 FL=1
MFYIGFDIGSSSVKVAIVEIATGKSVGVAQEPETEMSMFALIVMEICQSIILIFTLLRSLGKNLVQRTCLLITILKL